MKPATSVSLTYRWLAAFALLLLAFPALGQRENRRQNLFEAISERETFSTLVTAIEAAGLSDAIADIERATLFLPTNAAFERIPEEDLKALLGDTQALTALLTYHVVPGRPSVFNFRPRQVETLQGSNLTLSLERGFQFRRSFYTRILVNDSRVTGLPIRATNGIIYPIDQVLSLDFQAPQTLLQIAKSDENFSTLVRLAETAGISRFLDRPGLDLTVLAPTNAAFEALPEGALEALEGDRRELRKVLYRHLLRGKVASDDFESGTIRSLRREELEVTVTRDGITIENATVVTPDIQASNGIIHALDAVIMPEEKPTFLEFLESREDLTTYRAALAAAGLTDVFDRIARFRQFTFFAPDNDAFAALPEGALEELLADRGALFRVLLRHLSFRPLTGQQIASSRTLPTFFGRVQVGTTETALFLNGAAVLDADLETQAGIVHVMESIIPAETPVVVTPRPRPTTGGGDTRE